MTHFSWGGATLWRLILLRHLNSYLCFLSDHVATEDLMMREVRQAFEQIPNNNLDEVTAKGEDCINPKGSKTELQRSHKIFLNAIKVKTLKIVLANKIRNMHHL